MSGSGSTTGVNSVVNIASSLNHKAGSSENYTHTSNSKRFANDLKSGAHTFDSKDDGDDKQIQNSKYSSNGFLSETEGK